MGYESVASRMETSTLDKCE